MSYRPDPKFVAAITEAVECFMAPVPPDADVIDLRPAAPPLAVELGDRRSLIVHVTDEGVIFDAYENGELVGTVGRTFDEWWESLGSPVGLVSW